MGANAASDGYQTRTEEKLGVRRLERVARPAVLNKSSPVNDRYWRAGRGREDLATAMFRGQPGQQDLHQSDKDRGLTDSPFGEHVDVALLPAGAMIHPRHLGCNSDLDPSCAAG